MKVFKNQKLLAIGGLLALCSLSSCSRGYGCPYDFSVTDSLNRLSHLVTNVLTLIF